MNSNEDYLDNLLRSVNGAPPSDDGNAASADEQKEINSETDPTLPGDAASGEETDFPELARLFETDMEEAEEDGDDSEAEAVQEQAEAEAAAARETEAAAEQEEAEMAALFADEEMTEQASDNAVQELLSDDDMFDSEAVFSAADAEETDLPADSGDRLEADSLFDDAAGTLPDDSAQAEEMTTLPDDETTDIDGANLFGESDGDAELFRTGADMGDTSFLDDDDALFMDFDPDEEDALPDMDLSDLEALMSYDPDEDGTEAEPETPETAQAPQIPETIVGMPGEPAAETEAAGSPKPEELSEKDEDSIVRAENEDDMKNLMESLAAVGAPQEDDEPAAEAEAGTEKKKSLFGRKKKEKPVKADAGSPEKKQGLLRRLFAFFMEDEELEDVGDDKEQISVSEENIAILEGLDQEKKSKKKEKKPKAPKEKKEKKPKAPKEKKSKKEKKPKPKKEKKPKEPKEPEKPLKPIGIKKIMTGAFFGVTVFGMILLFTSYIPTNMEKQEGKKAFAEGDYQKAYDLLVTKKVNEEEEAALKGATLCLQMQRKMESYENFSRLEGMELERLHALISGVDKYWKIEAEAQQYGVSEPVRNTYLSILDVLQSVYGVSEEQAREIGILTDDVAYTKALKQILGGGTVYLDLDDGAHAAGEPETAEPEDNAAETEVDDPDEQFDVLPEDLTMPEDGEGLMPGSDDGSMVMPEEGETDAGEPSYEGADTQDDALEE